ncbi:MAG: HAD hydrolase family protein [Oscillospiraceae bacterium]|nr:HAD hydrolase family protein [Oscillospiraceae bacterium]
MRADQTALFTDLDGTLFNSKSQISRENREAIAAYMAEGGAFAISTGRAPGNARKFIGDLPTNAPSVVFNGGGVYDFSRDSYGFLLHMDYARYAPVFRWAIDAIPDLDLQVYPDDEIIYCTPLERARKDFLEMHSPCRHLPLEALADIPVVKALLLTSDGNMSLLGKKLEAAAPGAFDLKKGAVVLGTRLSYYETMPPEATKGAALRYLRSDPGLAGRTFLAAGDYWNDYEMLREADVSVAPGNAIPEIRALCTHITASNDEHAIAHIIRDIIPAL